MEGSLSSVPMMPPRARMPVPIRCPERMAMTPVLKPMGAKRPPVMISAMDMEAPNQRPKKLKKERLFLFASFIIHTCLFI